jgi:hypothetical protein
LESLRNPDASGDLSCHPEGCHTRHGRKKNVTAVFASWGLTKKKERKEEKDAWDEKLRSCAKPRGAPWQHEPRDESIKSAKQKGSGKRRKRTLCPLVRRLAVKNQGVPSKAEARIVAAKYTTGAQLGGTVAPDDQEATPRE